MFLNLGLKNHFFILALVASMLVACVQQPNSGRKQSSNSSSTKSTNVGTPTYDTSSNFFQLGQNTYTSTFPLSSNYTDSFYLKGSQVHQFIAAGNVSTTQCLVSYFPQSLGARFLVIAAVPSSFLNSSTGIKEYFYLLYPSNSTKNKTFCQKTGLLATLSTLDSSSTVAYAIADVCPNCTASNTFISQTLNLYAAGGTKIGDIQTSALKLYLTAASSSSTGANTCTSSSQCTSSGYDCCVDNQCAHDGQLKAGVDTSSDAYKQALQEILSNPSSIQKYTNFYFVCPNTSGTATTTTSTTTPEEQAEARLEKMHELYMCTTQLKGEMSICTATYKNANTTSSTVPFITGLDDRNFRTTQPSTSALPYHSLFEVTHAGVVLYKNNAFQTSTQGFYLGDSNGQYTGNDTLSDKVQIRLNHPITIPNDTLKISYKIDGSCNKINSILAQCTKYYIQGQNTGDVDDHYPGTDTFLLPNYVDTSRQISVYVDDLKRTPDTEWKLTVGTPSSITFLGSGQQVFDTQTVKIVYYVSLTTYPNLMASKLAALSEISTFCPGGIGFSPSYDLSGNIVNYTCVYPQSTSNTDLPLQREVLLTSKNIPVRFFDTSGVTAETVTSTMTQEGTAFKYINNDKKKPNNMNAYVGFNEIYGSLTSVSGSAKPPVEVKVEKGKTYSIFVDNGLFSTCSTCGSDYYATTTALFPSSIGGGGVNPTLYQNITDRFLTSGATYRADDFIFGRACFVPATMIPWTHRAKTPRNEQRLDRLAAQHFLFANGYQKDWYGFDYGSVIGSFDGVTWFSIGTQRQITSKSNKLFLAVNGYYADLTTEDTFRVTVTDSTANPSAGATVIRDYDSDGAQCQQFHSCSNDRECVTKLGWEYTCQTVTDIQTSWPAFDANALETPGKSQTLTLKSIIGDIGTGSKRCVYRGRGSPCYPNYIAAAGTAATNFDQADALGLHACTSNNYCQTLTQGIPVPKFNNRINRLPYSPNSYNQIMGTTLNTFGRAAKMFGRPLEYAGTASVPDGALPNLTTNHVTALCIPGRNVGTSATSKILDLSYTAPSNDHLGDVVNNQGMTPIGDTANKGYLSSCPVLDTSGNYVAFQTATASKTTTLQDWSLLAGAQNIPTNSIRILQASMDSTLAFLKNFKTNEGKITSATLEENRCLRAPFASCHTDLDCAPSEWASTKMNLLSIGSLNDGKNAINKYEIQFWKEGLVCGQPENKTKIDTTYGEIVNPNYLLKNNRCCRSVGKTITIGTFTASNTYTKDEPFFTPTSSTTLAIPGVDIDLTRKDRYSRFATVHYEMQTQATSYPSIRAAQMSSSANITDIYNQFNTFAKVAERTCCTENWVREFHTSNGGGHTWAPSKMQNIPITSFRCYNWSQCSVSGGSCSATSTVPNTVGFSCNHTTTPTDSNCLIRAVPKSETHAVFDWMNSLEILGVPQSTVAKEDFADINCKVDPYNQSLPGTATVPPNILKTASPEYQGSNEEGTDTGTFASGQFKKNFYSATGELKMVFSPDTVACCRPAGYEVPEGSDPKICCTGMINETTNRCALPDYSNISVFFNRYISSAAKSLDLSYFNPRTGFIKDRSMVMKLACAQKVCASGYMGTGIAYSKLPIPGHEGNTDAYVNRYVDSKKDSSSHVSSYDYGLRWNDDVYCIPQKLATSPLEGMTVMGCE